MSRPFRDSIRASSQFLWTCARQPSNLTSWRHDGPIGGRGAQRGGGWINECGDRAQDGLDKEGIIYNLSRSRPTVNWLASATRSSVGERSSRGRAIELGAIDRRL